ncbi:MAG: hypothetical protein AAF612_11930 [Planctomycetota bacterium]
MEIIGFIFLIVALLAGLVSIGCWIYNIVVAFQHNEVLLGILSICGIVGLIIGWVKVNEWGHRQAMTWWTIAIVVGIVCNVIGGLMLPSSYSP